LTTKYDALILKNTKNWQYSDAIARKVGGDKSAIIQAITRLVEIDYLEVSTNKNKVLYKKKDTLQKEFDFLAMMETFESNQKTELNRLKQISTLMMLDGKRFRSKGIELMEHVLEEINRAYMVKSRINHQKNLSIIHTNVAEERIGKLDKYVENIMQAVMKKHKEKHAVKAIQEYFQNHTTKLEINI
tara:strand:- start:130 stop:690 length:561 start_codon:yes stop_codon:yes gene_type:complete